MKYETISSACAIRDDFPSFKETKLAVVGVSPDSVESHKKFAKKHELPFTLLADDNKKVVKAYGVWVRRRVLGAFARPFEIFLSALHEKNVQKVYSSCKERRSSWGASTWGSTAGPFSSIHTVRSPKSMTR